jgi:nitrate/TMAO reductase-like tetraheme cytochrome c subunit
VGSFFAFLLLFAMDLFAEHANPYMGILAYVVAPGFSFFGLALVLAGMWIQFRKERKAKPNAPPISLAIDLSRPRDRKILAVFVGVGVVFLFMTALGSYQTYRYTESVSFCGQVCHKPMTPEFATSRNSPHARVDCVACHVGSGATAYVKTKISGMRQLYHVVRDDFETPIRLSPGKLRPARDTCEECHWPQKFTGGFERTFRHYLSDEKNTPFTVRMLMNVGGGDPKKGPVGGIHWHMNSEEKIEIFAAAADQRVIPVVRHTDAKGQVTEYRDPSFKGDVSKLTVHTMDCLDCHNRPSHKFLPPNDAVDQSLAAGKLDPKIPWVKARVVEALTKSYPTTEEAARKIEESLKAAYPNEPKVKEVVAEAQAIYKANFFPEVKADWRSYPDHLSHKNWEGCFRCHDGKHLTADKKTIKATDCKSCHIILAQGGIQEMGKMDAGGYDFVHIDAKYSDFSCTECHTGGPQKN